MKQRRLAIGPVYREDFWGTRPKWLNFGIGSIRPPEISDYGKAVREQRDLYPLGTRVKVSLPKMRNPRFATVVGYGHYYQNPFCVRVVFDGCTSPHTIHNRFISRTQVRLPASLRRVILGVLDK